MGLLTFPHIIRNGQKSSAAQLNENFQAVTAIVNKGGNPHGNIDGSNISGLASLTGATVTVTSKIVTATIDANGCLVIKLPSSDGSHSVKFKDGNGVVRLEVKSNGEAFVY